MVDLDSATVYVRERGQLRRINGIVLAETKQESSCNRPTNPLRMKKEHFVFTYNKEGSLRYTAKTLYDLSLLFIADNIHHVDSLVGFPEQVGDRLFVAAEEKQVFSDPVTAPRALQVFSDAYGEIVLSSLCLRNRFPLLSEKLEEIKKFSSLKSLDLFGCRLGDNHDIFQHLTSDLLSRSLANLFLGGNSLSDEGLQRLTAPIRMMKRGLNNLQLLGLSYNPVSERAIGYLACLPKLQGLDLSGTNVKLSTSVKKKLWEATGLILSEKPLQVFDHVCCKTEGWAEQVINQWETSATQLPKQKKAQDSSTAASHFFGRKKFIRGVLTASPLVWNKEDEDTAERLHFHKATHAHTHGAELPGNINSHTKPLSQKTKKRQHKPELGESGPYCPSAKRFSPSALSEEDLKLLNSY
ncbi:leucine-rich repeat-containing protein 42 isoform X1 [Hypomesus transpacificus]|uniref:leucine-rich repeat-containing protein 42 isoform X1 n=1 Tax=Hypomesus transpacificus TaxID=137520 RepID=UPI001F07A44A|nr:leucine-rich repeat-containing protein 42 isoform X1 [Hypomesus transpacificus]